MGIEQKIAPTHWNYFLCIEDDIVELARWIEPTKANDDCYSIELARLLMTASAEVDVLAQLICKDYCKAPQAKSIGRYQEILMKKFPNLPDVEVSISRYGLIFHPWRNWETANSSPIWWKANNKIKHQRSDHFHDATLKNVLNAVAAQFYLLVLYYGLVVGKIPSKPKLFESSLISDSIDGDMIFSPNCVVIPH